MKSKKKDLDGPRDIISGLHDTLICHILSFLPTREAASTSVLAKRWKHLIAFVPNLDFDFFYFRPPRTFRIWNESSESYLDFVDSVLALQAQANAPVDRFHLKCVVVEAYWLLNWIDNVLKRGVSDLDLYISSPWPSLDSIYYLLPSEMYVSKTLVKLKLKFRGGVFIKVLDDVSLPKLKTLHLDWIEIEKRTFNKLLSGCHVLEELVLVNLKLLCDSWQPKPLHASMSIPTLKRLKLKYFEDSSKSVFDIPNLVYLEYSKTNRYQQMSFDSLVEARLSLQNSMKETHETNILMGIRNVRILYLSDKTLEVLAHCLEIIPVFNNLLHLTITTPYVQWDLLPTLLKKCPSLQTLVFKGLYHIYTYICMEKDCCLCKYQDDSGENMDARTCLSSSSVKIQKILKFGKTFNDDDDDTKKHIEQVKHFIETTPNLDSTDIVLQYNK